MPITRCRPRIVIGSWTRIPKTLLADVEREKQRLRVQNARKYQHERRGLTHSGPEYFELYKEDGRYLYVPRTHKPHLRRGLREGDYTVQVDVPLPTFRPLGIDSVVLGPNQHQLWDQKPAYEALLDGPKWPYGKILALKCGAGKSAIALKAIHQRGGPALWINVNTTLLEQMKDEITKWLGIPRKKIGHVQGNKSAWEGKDIAVAMLHTLAKREYPPEFWSYWTTVVFDEGDALGADTFSQVAPRFTGERWVLTATRQRDDRMERLYEAHVGPVCFEYLTYEVKPDVYFLETSAPSALLVQKGWDPVRRRPRVMFATTARKLLEDDERNEQLFDVIDQATGRGRTCLVLGDSVDGLIYAVRNAKKRLSQYSHGLVVGRVGQKQRKAIIEGNQVVWATTRLAFRGLNRPAFDTLVIATLVSAQAAFWEQAGGRILRVQPNKKPPIIIALADVDIQPLAMMSAKLARVFAKKKWATHNVKELLGRAESVQRAEREERSRRNDRMRAGVSKRRGWR